MRSQLSYEEQIKNFSGSAPIFPLSNIVLFPHLAIPLHVYEDRYRKMVEDVLEGSGVIALALLKPGWEACRDASPPIHEMVCLGRITAEERLPNGRYNLVLSGLLRAVVVEEEATDLPYRTAQLELYRDLYSHKFLPAQRDERRRDLVMSFRRLYPRSHVDSLFAQMLDADLPVGMLCDLLANALQITAREKQELLEEVDVDVRSELLLSMIDDLAAVATVPGVNSGFPPKFSLN